MKWVQCAAHLGVLVSVTLSNNDSARRSSATPSCSLRMRACALAASNAASVPTIGAELMCVLPSAASAHRRACSGRFK